MNKIKNIIYWTCISVVGLWFILPILRWVTKIEYANNNIQNNLDHFFFYAIPIAVLLTLVKIIKKSDSWSNIVSKVIVTIIISFSFVVFFFMTIFIGMCVWYDSEILYQSKSDTDIKIIEREFGCGAWDSDIPKSKIFKVTKYNDYLIRTSEIDTSKIDKNEWTRVVNKN